MSLDEFTFTDGDENDFIKAVDTMYASEKWLVSYGDYCAYKRSLKSGKYRFIVCKDSAGDFIGSISIAILDDNLAFVDNFFVISKYRSHGLGSKMFGNAVTDKIREQCNVGLHSDVKVSEYYAKKQGFTKFPNVSVEVYHLTNFEKELRSHAAESKYRIMDTEMLTNDILTIDAAVLKQPRESLLSAWIQRKDSVTAVIYENDRPVGYGVMRKSCGHNSYILGPFYLTEEDGFLNLLAHLLQNVEDDATIEIRPPSINAKRLLEQLSGFGSLRKCAKFITQFTKLIPDYKYSNVYSITDTNLPI